MLSCNYNDNVEFAHFELQDSLEVWLWQVLWYQLGRFGGGAV